MSAPAFEKLKKMLPQRLLMIFGHPIPLHEAFTHKCSSAAGPKIDDSDWDLDICNNDG